MIPTVCLSVRAKKHSKEQKANPYRTNKVLHTAIQHAFIVSLLVRRRNYRRDIRGSRRHFADRDRQQGKHSTEYATHL